MRYLLIVAAALLSVPTFAQSDSADDFQFRADAQFEAQVAMDRYGPLNTNFEKRALTFKDGDPISIPTQSGEVLHLVKIADKEWVDRSGVLKQFSNEDDHACANVVERLLANWQVAISADAMSVNEKYVPAYKVARRCFHLKSGTESDYLVAELNEDGRVLRYGDSLQPYRGPYPIGGIGTDVAVNRYFLPTWKKSFAQHASFPIAAAAATSPILIYSVDAAFSEEARQQKIHGVSVVSLVVDTQGLPENIRVVRKLGHGLDEQAVAAVKQYRFKPSLKNGAPVPTEVTVNVNFHIY